MDLIYAGVASIMSWNPKWVTKMFFFFLFTGIKPLQFDSPAEKLPNDSLAGFVFLLQAPRPFYVPPLPPPIVQFPRAS